MLSGDTTQGIDEIHNVLVINSKSIYVFLGTNTKSVYVFLGIYLTYPFLAQERGGGVLDGLKKKVYPR